MPDGGLRIILVDTLTAATLSTILPVLLLTLAGEVRRTRILGRQRRLMAIFFIAFGTIETALLFSIDGAFYPFQWFDSLVGLIIFGLLAILFRLALIEPSDDDDRDGA